MHNIYPVARFFRQITGPHNGFFLSDVRACFGPVTERAFRILGTDLIKGPVNDGLILAMDACDGVITEFCDFLNPSRINPSLTLGKTPFTPAI